MFPSKAVFCRLLLFVLVQSSTATVDTDLFDESVVEESDGPPLSDSEFEQALLLPHVESGDGVELQGAILLDDDDIFEGDIRRSNSLALRQDAAIDGGKQSAAIIDETARWPRNRVPYAVSSRFRERARLLIAQAVGAVHRLSCVRFEPRDVQSDVDFIFFSANGSGCSADVGRFGGRQDVLLASLQCFNPAGNVLHELMHVLGFYHEQARSDRDLYVDINWQNIETSKDRNFLRYDAYQTTVLGTPYDYDSIMHYPATAFSVNGEPTIVPRVAGVTIGQRHRLSPLDVFELNVFYDCPANLTMPPAAHQLPEDSCGDLRFNLTTHDCCDGALYNRSERLCCGDRLWDVASMIGLQRRFGCCGDVLYFSEFGCCAGRLFNISSHRCCNDQIEVHPSDGLDCFGMSKPSDRVLVTAGGEEDSCAQLYTCLRHVADAHALCLAEQQAANDAHNASMTACERSSSFLRLQKAHRKASTFAQLAECLAHDADAAQPQCPSMLAATSGVHRSVTATGSQRRIQHTCETADKLLKTTLVQCKTYELACPKASVCWQCYENSTTARPIRQEFYDAVDENCECEDGAWAQCEAWRADGHCATQAERMRLHCRKSCQFSRHCPPCQDLHPMCAEWAARGECRFNADMMLFACKLSCDLSCKTLAIDLCDAPLQDKDIESGGGLPAVHGKELDECCDVCHETAGCQAFAWNDYLNGTCWLKHDAFSLVARPGVWVGAKSGYFGASTTLAPANDEPLGSCETYMEGVDIVTGGGLRPVHGRLADECCAECHRNPACRAFSWSTFLNGTCWPKTDAKGLIYKKGVKVGFRAGYCDRSAGECGVPAFDVWRCGELLEGKDIDGGGGLAAVHGKAAAECCAVCALTEGCVAFVWNDYRHGSCWLKTDAENIIDKPGAYLAILRPPSVD